MALHEPPNNEATSSANHGIQNPNDLDSVMASVEAVEAEYEILHVPTFMEVQVNLNASGTVGVYALGSANLVVGATHLNNLGSGLSEESQFTPITVGEGSGFLVVVDVMLDRFANHPDQMQRNSGVPDGGNVLSATIGEHGGEMVFAADVAPLIGVDGLVFNNGPGGGSSFSSKAHVPKPVSWKKRARA